jgi:hypothetical protein
VALKGRRVARVVPLDHDGRVPPDPAAVPVRNSPAGAAFDLDGAKTLAVYYLVELE